MRELRLSLIFCEGGWLSFESENVLEYVYRKKGGFLWTSGNA